MTKAEWSILLTDDLEIKALNAQYRQIDKATDVLSFPLAEADELAGGDYSGPLGDVIISLETAVRQSTDGFHQERVSGESQPSHPWTLAHEVLFLMVHGLLHLLGHDHHVRVEAARMQRREQELFALVRPRPSR